jgi:hypothetical protein
MTRLDRVKTESIIKRIPFMMVISGRVLCMSERRRVLHLFKIAMRKEVLKHLVRIVLRAYVDLVTWLTRDDIRACSC